MNYPTEYTLWSIADSANKATVYNKTADGKWVPARPLGYPSLIRRFKLAWKVFTGKADIVIWPGDQ